YPANGLWYVDGQSFQQGVCTTSTCVNTSFDPRVYEWAQGQSPVNLGPALGARECFLTRITGRFKGGGESVGTYMWGGAWWLGGSSGQIAVAASAMCITSGHLEFRVFAWSQGSPPTPLGPAADRACMLTKVQGDFEGGGEHVHTWIDNGSWYLG